MIKIRKLYDPETLKYKFQIQIDWYLFSLTGFWFTDKRFV
jgi:hypothetical protein